MASSTVSKRILKARQNGFPLDRLSTLRGSIIGRILSFLPTKQAVGTSILSKTWINLWTSVTNLDFDDEWKENVCENPVEKGMQKRKFVYFVYHVLALLNSPSLHKFSLKCELGDNSSYINTCMRSALRRDVEIIDVSIDGNGPYDEEPVRFPGNLSTWKALVILKLSGYCITLSSVFAETAAFPKLKTLHLLDVEYEDDESLPNFLSGCPVLDDLVINRMYCGEDTFTPVVSSSLVNLKMRLGTESSAFSSHLVIIAPALRFLSLSDTVSDQFSFKDLSSLETAFIDVYPPDKSEGPVLEILYAIANVSKLKLSKNTMHILRDAPDLGFKFSNLRSLELSFGRKSWCGLKRLLDSSDMTKLIELKTSSR